VTGNLFSVIPSCAGGETLICMGNYDLWICAVGIGGARLRGVELVG
jgi:hypothetical protein